MEMRGSYVNFQACSCKTGEGIWEGFGQLCDAFIAIDKQNLIEKKSVSTNASSNNETK